jgi:phosphate transport system protein
MIVSVLKAISDIERVGDKARKIARLGIALSSQPAAGALNIELNHMAETALRMLRLSLDGFARLDTSLVTEAMHLDTLVNAEYQSVARQLITYMMEDPRTITRSLDIMSIAKAIERIGDHATNIAEYVVYMVKGLNVRHSSADEIDAQIANS